MNKGFSITLLFLLLAFQTFSQVPENREINLRKGTSEPFLFSATTLTASDRPWSLDYSTTYGERVSENFGFDGVGQQLGVKGYLGNKFTFLAQAALGFDRSNNITSRQQAEVIRNFIGGTKKNGLRIGIGLGGSRDFSNVGSLLSRVAASYETGNWVATGNLLFQKAFAANRDNIDIISSFGFHHRLLGNLYGGFETVGEDLEGFWDSEEAEGGAKLLLGPSLNMTSDNSKFSFSVSGGPVFYATKNDPSNPETIRDLPSQPGMTLRARVIFNLSR